MKRKDPKGDVRTAASDSSRTATSSTSSPSAASNSTVVGAASEAYDTSLKGSLSMLMSRDDGWLRLVPHLDEGVIYAKWKFVRGPWTGYYAMWRDDNFDAGACIIGLRQKLSLIDRGMSKPVYDVPYNL